MKQTYKEIMDNVKVTPEMRCRVLDNVQARMEQQERPRSFTWRRAAAIAACAAVVLAGALTLPKMTVSAPEPTPGDEMAHMAVPNIVDCGSLQELSAAVGFEVLDLAELPFEPESISFTSYWGELAEITYEGGRQTLTLRQSAGSEDNSGDSNEYADVETRDADGLSVTLKGEGGQYALALWTDGGYAYSLCAAPALPAETLLALAAQAGKQHPSGARPWSTLPTAQHLAAPAGLACKTGPRSRSPFPAMGKGFFVVRTR